MPILQKDILKQSKIFKNRFGHLRAGWRILIYIAFIIIFSKLLDLFENSFLLIQSDNLSDYTLLWNRFVSKFFQLLAVFIPGIVLLKWADKRPIALLGIGLYKRTLKELSIGMLMGFILIPLSIFILWLTGVATFSFNGFSMDLLIYLLSVLGILVISAAYEEFLFRGYIFQSLIEGSNFSITLGIYSLLFGAAHLSNKGVTVFTIAVTVIAGVFLGVIYFKTRALWMCIGVHFIWNWTMGPLFGMGLSESRFLRRSLFTYQPSESLFINGQDVISEIILGVLLLALTIYLWKAKWLRPAECNRKLWLKYPAKYGTEPEMGK
jgi:membrane protease YdiL (CAAX protease family)